MYKFTHVNLFPILISGSNIDRHLTDDEKRTVDLLSNDRKQNAGNNTSTVNTYVLNEHFPEIRKFIEHNIQHYVESAISAGDDVEFYITQSWLNWTEPGKSHHRHAHANSIISGVFYFNADPAVDRIYFYNDRTQQLRFSPKQYNMYNSEHWWLPCATGDVILFPSTLYHKVQPVVNKETRISLAFNVFARGSFGDDASTTSLFLK